MIAMATTRNESADFSAPAAQLQSGQFLVSLASSWSLDVTRWLYDPATDLLLQKLYADGNAVVVSAYDYMGRRVKKEVYAGSTKTAEWVYPYDGWNMIQEVRIQNSGVSTNQYVWGLDLSGSLQGAGGVGGLLAVIRPDLSDPSNLSEYLPAYDANGNVSEYVE